MSTTKTLASNTSATSHWHDGTTTPLATSQEIRDRGSTFVGYVCRARTVDEARGVFGRWRAADLRGSQEAGMVARVGASVGVDMDGNAIDVRHMDKGEDVGRVKRTYEDGEDRRVGFGLGLGEAREVNNKNTQSGPYVIAAWRCMAVKPGRTGLGGPDDFAVQEGCEDGGERWAGGRVLSVMKREGVMDAVVVVCRWFGGTLLGPVRFTHVETCTSEVCRRFKKIEEMDECIQTLRTLDDLLATLRAELVSAREQAGIPDSGGTGENSRSKRVTDYHVIQDSLDLTKAKRLIHARECGIEATKALIEKCKTST